MVYTTQIQTSTCTLTDEDGVEIFKGVSLLAPGISIYLTREQAVQLATNLLTGFLQTVPDVSYKPD